MSTTVIQLLLDKEGFPNDQLPVLVVRQNDVKSRSVGCLERSGDRKQVTARQQACFVSARVLAC